MGAATSLVLSGAALAGDDGGDRPPVLVVLGPLSVLVYAVVPDEDAPAVSVTVRNGPTWGVTGLVGSTEPAETVADRIAEAGLPGVLSRVTAADGEVTVAWIDARRTR